VTDGLLVHRTAFLTMLKQFKLLSKARGRTLAYLSYDLGVLRVQALSARVGVEARGVWPNPIAVNAVMLARLSTNVPKKDPLLLQYVLGRLYVDTFSLDAKPVRNVPLFTAKELRKRKAPEVVRAKVVAPLRSEPPSAQPSDALSIPPNAPAKYLLRLHQTCSQEQIAMAGLTGRMERALLERNRKISKALELLSGYGVRSQDLQKLVSECVQR